ncbi:hypothetical protein [Spirochaeta isovalerica]|uniref:Uncharacterized protein n=1 Tax=Spirochaeta isovalerica TaxID=150 RepID=A0A841RDX7_9SPIO|nr:hypothetical protein [Spirochaeta isovalerica]MBB6481049.1 hypothetical protein [Spirochaeta isovalerica]
MKKNRRSERHKAEKFQTRAQYLLENFTWDTEERILLDVMAQGTLSMSDAREASWMEVKRGLDLVIIKGVELKLSEESLAAFDKAMSELVDFSGEEIDPRNTLHKIFSHETGKNISKELAQTD